MFTRNLRAAAACALFATTALVSPAAAQTATSPTFRQLDANGVDLVRGDFVSSIVEGSIGSGDAQLSLLRVLGPAQGGTNVASQWDRMSLYRTANGSLTSVEFGQRSDIFPGAESRGAKLTGSGGSWQHTAADGTVIAFTNNEPNLEMDNTTSNQCRTGADLNCSLLPTVITSPDGKVFNLSYEFWTLCIRQTPPGEWPSPDDPTSCTFTPRLSRVSNSHGYAIAFSYASGPGYSINSNPPASFRQRTGASFINTAVSPNAQASVSYANPAAGVTNVTDMGGRVWRVTGTTIRRPGAAADTTVYTRNASGLVTSIVNEGVTTNYNRVLSGNTITMTVTNALNQQTVVTSDATIGRPTSVKDALNRTTSFQYDTDKRLKRTTMPEGNYVELTYDARGNTTATTAVAKAGSGLANLVTSASFDASCSNPKTCNKPNSTTDARGNTTNYTYDQTHGGVLSVTAPAPAAGGVRPQTRYNYTLVNGEYRLTGTSACQTQASCVGTADEVKSSVAYDANGNVTATSSGNGTGSLTATQAMTYDAIGNLLTVDGALPGSADTSRFRYNAAREKIGEISADPDGGGALKHRAVRYTYTNALLAKTERGTVSSQSDADWAAFSPAEAVDLTRDANARIARQSLASGGTTYAVTQTSYDALGRPDCLAVRMNPAIYASLPPSACTLGTAGSAGPDRINRTLYDAAGQVTSQQVAVGTADQADEATFSYSQNGKLATLKDGENNLTTYVYDGFDRLSRTRYPLPTKGASASSTTDYEELSYNAASNVTQRRVRDGQTIAFTYDNLDRPTLKNLPGSEPDVSYGYDNLNRLTSASQTGNALSFTYDALGRNLTQTGPQGTVTSAWDLAGRRTRLTYPGSGLFLDHDYLVTGEMTAIRENGATSGVGVLATFAYDDFGRRTGLTRGNGAVTSYAYDPVSRLASWAENLAGTANDQTTSFSYNPAAQIASLTRSNDAYAWTGHGSGSTASVANGLNQLTSVGGAAVSHDARGNLTADPTSGKSHGYSSENLLTSSTGGTAASLAYDPAMRLYQVTAGAMTARFAYDGVNAIAEYDSASALQRRYVFGSGVDEVLVEYSGASTANRNWLHSDERGSVVAISDGSGAATQLNRYDEYGKPQAANTGRFQYTGQMWLPESGLFYYKARMYSPHFGRFTQVDPIGVSGGLNLYGYVNNDPANGRDPFGLCEFVDVGYGWYTPSGEYLGPADGKYYVLRGFCMFSAGGSEAGGGGGGGGRPVSDDAEPQLITVVGTKPKRLNDCTIAFLSNQGYSAPNLSAIRFIRGHGGVPDARLAFFLGHPAITIANEIFVHPDHWSRVSSPSGGPTFFEEIIHSMQWNIKGHDNFGLSYIRDALFGGVLLGGDAHSNPAEAQAIGISNQLYRSYTKGNQRCN